MKICKITVLYSAFSVFILLIAVLAGCSAGGERRNFVRPDSNIASIKKIAVMPFESFVINDDYAGEKIRRVVMTELLMAGYEVMEPGEITRELIAMNKPLRSLTIEELKKIGNNLGVDALLMGSVETYKISTGLTIPYPDISLNMRLIDAASGVVVWSVVHTSGGPGVGPRHFGTEGPSLDDAAHKVVKEAVEALVNSRKGN